MADINPGDVVTVATYSGTIGAPVGGFRNKAGALTDPTTVTLRWRRHGDTEQVWLVTAGQIVKDAVGLYHADLPITGVGLHYFRWEGIGVLVAAEEGTFSVTSNFVAGMP